MYQEPPAPQAVTREWIAREPAPYTGVESYFQDLLVEVDGTQEMTLLGALPRGYRLIYMFWRLYTDVENGGFWQFLGNAGAVDESHQIVADTVNALTELGMPELASLLKRAIAAMGARLPPAALSALAVADRERASQQHLSDDEMTAVMYPLDQQFNQLNGSFFGKFDAYIKAHPEEFVHPVEQGKLEP